MTDPDQLPDIDEMKKSQYFGLLLATSAQIYEPGHSFDGVVMNAARLIDQCAKEAGIDIDEIR